MSFRTVAVGEIKATLLIVDKIDLLNKKDGSYMERYNLFSLHNREKFINGVIAPAWYLYDQKIKDIFNDKDIDVNDKILSMREFSAKWVFEIAYKLLGISLSEEMSNPVVYVNSEDAIDIYLAKKEGISIFEARKIETGDKTILLRDEIKEKAKYIFDGDNSLIPDNEIRIHNSCFNRQPLNIKTPCGVEAIKKELLG